MEGGSHQNGEERETSVGLQATGNTEKERVKAKLKINYFKNKKLQNTPRSITALNIQNADPHINHS